LLLRELRELIIVFYGVRNRYTISLVLFREFTYQFVWAQLIYINYTTMIAVYILHSCFWDGVESLYGEYINSGNKKHLQDKVVAAFRALYKLHVLHCDIEIRNLVYNSSNDSLIVVDFEWAEIQDY
jgi:hypothetical protein